MKDKITSLYRKAVPMCATLCTAMAMSLTAFAAETGGGSSTQTVYDSSAFASVIEAITNQISVETVVKVLAGGAAIAVGFAFVWWGGRKVLKMIMSGFKKGRVSM